MYFDRRGLNNLPSGSPKALTCEPRLYFVMADWELSIDELHTATIWYFSGYLRR